MAAVVQAINDIQDLLGRPAVVVGGIAVLTRLSRPHRTTTDLDLVDQPQNQRRQLEILRAAAGAQAVEPAAVILPTILGPVKIDVLEVRQAELDNPSADPGDRLHTTAHAWAFHTATNTTIHAQRASGEVIRATARIAEPGPLIAMKLQAIMDRSSAKQGTDLLDIVRLTLDPATRPAAMAQLGTVDPSMARDLALHVDLWLVRNRVQSLRWIHDTRADDVTSDDLALVTELLQTAIRLKPGEPTDRL